MADSYFEHRARLGKREGYCNVNGRTYEGDSCFTVFDLCSPGCDEWNDVQPEGEPIAESDGEK